MLVFHELKEDQVEQSDQTAVAQKVYRVPVIPSAEEVAKHNENHIPFRSWCPHCVMGKAREAQKQRRGIRSQQGDMRHSLRPSSGSAQATRP